jgi:hypothetical protein
VVSAICNVKPKDIREDRIPTRLSLVDRMDHDLVPGNEYGSWPGANKVDDDVKSALLLGRE